MTRTASTCPATGIFCHRIPVARYCVIYRDVVCDGGVTACLNFSSPFITSKRKFSRRNTDRQDWKWSCYKKDLMQVHLNGARQEQINMI